MDHSCEASAERVLDALAAHQGAGPVGNRKPIVPSLLVSWDEKNARVALSHRAGTQALLELEGRITGQPKWLTLQLDLGEGAFAAGDVIGLAAEITCDADHDFEPLLRSAVQGRDIDTRFAETLRLSPEQPVATALHTVAPGDRTLTAMLRHRLILRLPRRDFRLQIRGLRFFVVPHASAPTEPSKTTAGAAE